MLDSSFALLALPVSSAARGIVAVRAPRLSRCTLGQQGEGLQQRECASRPLGRRAFTSAASALLIALPFSAPSLAVAEDCSYAALTTLRSMLNGRQLRRSTDTRLRAGLGCSRCPGGESLSRSDPSGSLWCRRPSASACANVARSAPSRLPAALTKVNSLATGDPKVALPSP